MISVLIPRFIPSQREVIPMNEPLHIVLVEPEIHWNTGNAGRTCLAAGARLHLVEPLGFSLDDKQVRRAGLDYWPYVTPRLWKSWDELDRVLPEIGHPVFFSTKAQRLYSEVRYARPAVLVFGRETGGLSAHIHERYADQMVRIPIESPHVRSLNLSTAVGIAAYEVLRQWREE
jgi:tRNA (cytidine/uridine-2'-O-)-methyltransferase